MIKPAEIHALAGEAGVRETQMEKDYAISWVLLGISKNVFLSEHLAFKGGTVLKKAYFPDYRFSEDLDFTFTEKDFDTASLKTEFEKIMEWVYAESRIRFSIANEKQHETGNYNFYLTYSGPLGGAGANKNIKVDIANDELICDTPQKKRIYTLGSDLAKHNYELLCYTLSEIISEKLRAVMQRTAPRDIYDLWFLFEQEGHDIQDYISAFQEKAKYKKKDPSKLVEEVMRKENTFQKHWEDHLSTQMNEVPDFAQVWRELGKHWKKFEKVIKK